MRVCLFRHSRSRTRIAGAPDQDTTAPTDESILVSFFQRVRPFGGWGPIRAKAGLSPKKLNDPAEGVVLAAVNVLLSGVVILGVYLSPMYLVGHWHVRAVICLATALAAGIALYFTWYLHLPPADDAPKA